jgi:hypothetical protein
MRIGYSFWGFLGAGITDTPDGGRSHRRTLIDGLLAAGHDVVFLQANRDLLEADDDLGGAYTWDDGLPAIDVLMLEWRWRVPGRNDTACGGPGHTCDLHRQDDLVRYYIHGGKAPALVWDKDLQMPASHPLRAVPAVTICEAALYPGPGAARLLFPVADAALDAADPAALAAMDRDLSLVYAGNQYDRDTMFGTFFVPAAAAVNHIVAGKWPHTQRWPQVNFTGRLPFSQVESLHRRALATMLLAPDRYAARGQYTQRIFEAVLTGCLPLTPACLRGAGRVVPRDLIVTSGAHASSVLTDLLALAGGPRHADLIARCLKHLDIFRLSRQLDTLNQILAHATGRRQAPPRPQPS